MKQCIYCDIHFYRCHNSKSPCFLHSCKDQNKNCSLYISRDDYENKHIKPCKSKSQREELDWTASSWNDVYVYWHQSDCYKKKHKRTDFNAKVHNVYNNEFIYLKIFWCENCQKFFTNGKLLPKYEVLHNIRGAFLHNMPNGYYMDFGMSSESILRQHGYSVRANGPSAQKRHNILQEIILEEVLTPYDIIDHISSLIDMHYFDPKWENALQKYREDLDFLNDYKSKNYTGNFTTK